MRSIGEMARASGLSVSALRFYDGVGVLVPAVVDPETGYRWYAGHQLPAARLVAGLRRVGMPVADIGRVLAHLPDTAAVRALTDAHLRRLEDGLTDARRELSRIHALLDLQEHPVTTDPTRLTVSAAELAAAVDAVRFAVGHDPALPALGGILLEVADGALHLVATDRYRLAYGRAGLLDLAGPPVRGLVPAGLVDEARALLAGAQTVVLDLCPGRLSVDIAGRQVAGPTLDHDFPDHRRLLDGVAPAGPRQRMTVDVAELRTALAPGVAPAVVREHDGRRHEVVVLTVGPGGTLVLAGEQQWQADADRHVAVNREFLLQALDAGGAGQLVLELDGPIAPLAVRVPGDPYVRSILMPIRA